MNLKIDVSLEIIPNEAGEPLPYLKIVAGHDIYRIFDGPTVSGWRSGCSTRYSATLDLDLTPEVAQAA